MKAKHVVALLGFLPFAFCVADRKAKDKPVELTPDQKEAQKLALKEAQKLARKNFVREIALEVKQLEEAKPVDPVESEATK